MEHYVKRGSEATLLTDEQKEICLSLDHCYTEGAPDDPIGHVVI